MAIGPSLDRSCRFKGDIPGWPRSARLGASLKSDAGHRKADQMTRSGLLIRCAISVLTLTFGPSTRTSAQAEELAAIRSGLTCLTPQALSDLSLPNGDARGYEIGQTHLNAERSQCQDVVGATVTLVTKRPNTSIVTCRGRTYYVASIDFMTPDPGCIKEGATVTLSLRLGRATEEPGLT